MRRFVAVLPISLAAVTATACNREPQQDAVSETRLEAPNLDPDTPTATPQAPVDHGTAAARTIEDRVRDIIAEELGVEREKLTANAAFSEDLGADSLDAVELVMACEKEFHIDISDQDAEKLRTVGDAIGYIRERVAGPTH